MKFLRFGEIPKGERSINFFKMTNEQNDNYTYAFDNYGYYEALELVPEYAFESGVSCFALDGLKPVLDSLALLRSFCARIKDDCYIIEAEQVGTGNDGEPLVKNVQTVGAWQTTEEERVALVYNILCAMFNNVKELPVHGDSCALRSFTDCKTGRKSYIFNGWEFSGYKYNEDTVPYTADVIDYVDMYRQPRSSRTRQ